MARYLVAVFSVLAISYSFVFANGGPHGAYLGKGVITDSCWGENEFISTYSKNGFDAGYYFYYGLRVDGHSWHIADNLLLSDQWMVVFGDSDLKSGRTTTYEDCPGRDICEGQCCEVGEDGVTRGARSGRDSGTEGHSGSEKRYPMRTKVVLETDNGDKTFLEWTQQKNSDGGYTGSISLEGKAEYEAEYFGEKRNCTLSWKDELTWHNTIPADIAKELECPGGDCRWK